MTPAYPTLAREICTVTLYYEINTDNIKTVKVLSPYCIRLNDFGGKRICVC